MTLETTRILGGIGTILMLIFPLAGQGGLVGIIGLILVMIALSQLSYHYHESGIFNNALYGIIIAIIGIAIFTTVLATTALTFLKTLGIENITWNDWSALQRIDWPKIVGDWNTFLNRFWPEITMVILAFVILFALLVIAALFLRRSFSSVGAKTGIRAFYTAGMLMLVGAILTIVVGVGFIILWIALIFLAIGFFRIKTT